MLHVAWSPIYNHPLPEGHRFPMIKYDLLPEQLIYEGTISPKNIFTPAPLEDKYILNTHNLEYLTKLKCLALTPQEERRTGFPLSHSLVEREIVIMNGTVQAALLAKEHGIAFNSAGGTHHAYTNRGEGFCLLNDIAIAANYLLETGNATKILVIDMDVHQGNGTAEIFKDKEAVFTFSMHGANNYPLHKESSDMDIGLPDKTDDTHYLKILDNTLPALLDKVQPDFIFYQSGVDVLATDKLGKLSMTREGCKERDRLVLDIAKRNRLPIAVSMGGGYSEKIADIIEAHANTYRLAQEIFF